jgi:ribonuclease HI
MKKIEINTDGGARGNPGPAGIGVVIKNDHGLIVGRFKDYIGEATNNVAEYKALIRGLVEANQMEATHLQINMDSELVVKQMQGKYKIKEPTLQILAKEVVALIGSFEAVTFTHVRRELNKEADRLVNEAIDESLS